MKAFEPFLRIFTNPCFFPFYDWSSFRWFYRYSFCIIFLSFSSIEKKHRKWYITIVWTQLEKKQHFYTMNKKQPFFEKAYFHSPNAKHKIHKNNKMHFYKNYNSTLYNTDSPCWIILFPRHLSYHHTTLYVHCDI